MIAVLDYEFVLRGSVAARDIRRQVEQFQAAYREEASRDEQRLRAEEAELKRQRTVLSPEAFEKKRQKFERRVIAAQRRAQDRKRRLDRSFKTAMAEVQRGVIPIVKQLTQEMGFNLVVDKSQVLFATKALDVTDRVVAELNRRLPSVAVPKPE